MKGMSSARKSTPKHGEKKSEGHVTSGVCIDAQGGPHIITDIIEGHNLSLSSHGFGRRNKHGSRLVA